MVTSASSFSDSVVKVGRHRVVDEVRERLIASIKAGELKINERLPSENELARLFGVSRPVIREALVSLEAMGLTISKNGAGTFVVANQIKADLMFGGYAPRHLNQVRRYLEIPCAEQAAENSTDDQLAELHSILAQMEVQEDASLRNKLDADFHVAIAMATGNPLLTKLVVDLRIMVTEEASSAAKLPYRRSDAHKEHHAIYEAIAAHNPKKAKAAMAKHMDSIDFSIDELIGISSQ